MIEAFEQYGHALASLALFALLSQVLSAVSAFKRSNAGFGPGQVPPTNYDDPVYRMCRSYHNTVDNVGAFAAAIGAAVLAGAAPFWVNLFASIAIVARLAFVFIYIRGIGPADLGVRSYVYVLSSLMTMLIAVLALLAVLF